MKRFHLYNRLIDISFLFSVLYLLRLVGKVTGLLPETLPQPLDTVYPVISAGAFALSVFVVIAWFWRDEYAQRIWDQTASKFVYFLALGPVLLGLAIWAIEGAIETAAANRNLPAAVMAVLPPNPDPAVNFISGMASGMIVFGILAPQVFVVLYKLMQWRDTR